MRADLDFSIAVIAPTAQAVGKANGVKERSILFGLVVFF
jgi:hypothetical protein